MYTEKKFIMNSDEVWQQLVTYFSASSVIVLRDAEVTGRDLEIILDRRYFPNATSLIIYNCHFHVDVSLVGGNDNFRINLSIDSNCTFDKELNLSSILLKEESSILAKINELKLFRGDYKCLVLNYEVEKVHLLQVNIRNLFIGDELSASIFEFHDCDIKQCVISTIKRIDKILFTNIQITWLNIRGLRGTHVVIDNLRCNILDINNCRIKLDIDSILRRSQNWNFNYLVFIVNCDFGEGFWQRIDFQQYDFVNIADVRLSKIALYNVIWPNTIYSIDNYKVLVDEVLSITKFRSIKIINIEKLDEDKIIEQVVISKSLKYLNDLNIHLVGKDREGVDILIEVDNNYNYTQKDFFRQLKLNYSSNKDIVMETFFHRQEMLAYNRSLGEFDLFKNGGQKIILGLSEGTGEFGTNIWKPIGWIIFATSIALFALISLGLFNDVKLGANSCKELSEGMGVAWRHFFPLINPAIKDENLKMTFISGLIRTLLLVWNSYMIYNFIRATRRYIN